jgi:hypothetical protein
LVESKCHLFREEEFKMRRFAIAPVVVLGLVGLCVGASLAAPEQARDAGLDFWNLGNEEVALKEATAAEKGLESDRERTMRRAAVGDQIATSLCEDRITFAEALESVAALVQACPDWFSQIRCLYTNSGSLPPTATDRELMIQYLRTRLKSQLLTAQNLGNKTRAAFVAARIARFDDEVRRSSADLPHSASAH